MLDFFDFSTFDAKLVLGYLLLIVCGIAALIFLLRGMFGFARPKNEGPGGSFFMCVIALIACVIIAEVTGIIDLAQYLK